jgi:tetratricopeptide (TPR) repeat protein
LDLQLEQQQQGQALTDLYEGVLALKRRYRLHEVLVLPRDSLAVRRDGEREQVHELVKRYRDVSGEQQRRLPALLNSLGQLQVLVGEFDAAQNDFDEVAGLVSDHAERAEAHHNTYRAALEQRDWSEALGALLRACALDPDNCEPFPLKRYEPRAILGAGAFGVSFLCTERDSSEEVVVKVLREDSLDRPSAVLFREFQWLQDLDHPALARVRDFGYADANQTRPYVVLDYFEGTTLAEHIKRNGPLAPTDALAVLWPVARALQAAHNRGVLHRSLCPSCILVRRVELEMAPAVMSDEEDNSRRGAEAQSPEEKREGNAGSASPPVLPSSDLCASAPLREMPFSDAPLREPQFAWQVKVLDTGLALKRTFLHAAASNPAARIGTSLGRGVSQRLAYAPPEVTGRPKGMVWVGPHSDVFVFGRLCWFALTGRPEPSPGAELPPGVAEAWLRLVCDCAAWTLSARPEHFGPVLDRLSELPGAEEVIDQSEQQMDRLLLADYDRALERNPDSYAARMGRANLLGRMDEDDRALEDYSAARRLQPRDAALFRRRGQLFFRRGDFDEAVADFGQAIDIEPRNPENWSLRASVHARRGDHAAAIADYQEVLRLNPKDEEVWFSLGNSHYCLRDFEAAIADYTAVLRLNPKSVWAFGNRGKAHALRGEHAQAVEDFTRLLHVDPDNTRATWDRALSLQELGRREEALADFTRAIERTPSAGLYNDRGLAYAAASEHDKAIADFTRAHELDSESPYPLMYRGNSHCDRGELDQALADLDEAALLGPKLAVLFYNRGNVLAQRGDHPAALADYTHAIELAPDYIAAYYNRANSHVERGDLDAAVADYTAVLKRNPGDAAAYNNRGNAHSSCGDLDAALADFSEALGLDPADVVALFNRANTYARLGDPDRALADYTEILRLQPQHARALNNRGNLYYDKGDLEKALADYTQAVECDPTYARALNNRAGLLAERGESDQALADFNRAIELDPGYVAAWYGRGNLRLARGELDEAIVDFTELLKLEPRHAGALVDRAGGRYRRGDHDGALADLSAATEADPGYATAWFARAGVRAALDDLDGALADYTRAIELNTRHLPAYHNRGRLHARRGDYAAALADNLEALKIDPDNDRTLNNLAWLWATCPRDSLRDGARALEHALRACERTDWEVAGYLDTLATAYAECGQFEEAARWQARAVELASEEEKADYQSRLELYRQGKPYRDA